jgi:hypothetical protein
LLNIVHDVELRRSNKEKCAHRAPALCHCFQSSRASAWFWLAQAALPQTTRLYELKLALSRNFSVRANSAQKLQCHKLIRIHLGTRITPRYSRGLRGGRRLLKQRPQTYQNSFLDVGPHKAAVRDAAQALHVIVVHSVRVV